MAKLHSRLTHVLKLPQFQIRTLEVRIGEEVPVQGSESFSGPILRSAQASLEKEAENSKYCRCAPMVSRMQLTQHQLMR